MIDTAIRSQGIGGSEISALVGIDPRRDAFAVYAEKLGLVDRDEPNARMKWGKRLERVIAEAYAEESKRAVSWWDRTIIHPDRPWHVGSPDAFVTVSPYAESSILTDEEIARFRVGGLDCKAVAFDQADQWGESGTNVVPEHIALQAIWYCSAVELPWWDIAALFGGNTLRIYRIHRDLEIEGVLLTEAEKFWTNHVLARNPPPIGGSETAAAYLRKRFPRNIEALRSATKEEAELLGVLKDIRQKYDKIAAQKKAIENEVKLVIAGADGLTWGKDKVTFKICRDTTGTNWEAVARAVCEDEDRLAELVAENEIIVKHGSRRLLVPRAWKAEGEDEE